MATTNATSTLASDGTNRIPIEDAPQLGEICRKNEIHNVLHTNCHSGLGSDQKSATALPIKSVSFHQPQEARAFHRNIWVQVVEPLDM